MFTLIASAFRQDRVFRRNRVLFLLLACASSAAAQESPMAFPPPAAGIQVTSAQACLLKGDPAAAVGWLATIPPQFLPPSTAEDPRLAALKDRADFQALFTRK